MKKTTQWGIVAALAAAGMFGFACGGGGGESAPANAGSAPAATSAAPTDSSTPAPSSTPAASAAPAPVAPPLAVVAMKLSVPKQKDAIELKDDGTVEVKKKMVLKFVGNELHDADNKVLASVGADGSLTLDGAQQPAKFDDKDDLVLPDGAKMQIGDDGVVKLLDKNGKADKDSGKLKFTGFKPTARRAATVLVVAAMMVRKDSESAPVAAKATATATPATPKKK